MAATACSPISPVVATEKRCWGIALRSVDKLEPTGLITRKLKVGVLPRPRYLQHAGRASAGVAKGGAGG